MVIKLNTFYVDDSRYYLSQVVNNFNSQSGNQLVDSIQSDYNKIAEFISKHSNLY